LPTTQAVAGKGTDTSNYLPSSRLTNSNNKNGNTTAPHWLSKSNSIDVEDNNNKKQTTREQGAEYSATEILLLSKAWISASENTLVGVNQKISTFWESVLHSYNTLKQQQEDYMQRQREKEKFRLRNLQHAAIGNGEDSDSDEDEDVYQLPTQNLNSLQQKWSKKIQPLLFKFIGITNRYPRRSGEDREAYYNRVHLIFLKENDGEKSFDVYQPAWEYLQDKPKFSVSCSMPSKRKEVIL
jgi:hypothetical protein